ncbi:MAG: biotin transporter BioY [Clostridiales bacterium]|nr:biotin transporter BioY [Clostridiales bacterium]
MKTRSLILTALFAALTAVGAFLKIPFPLSAITLQFFFTAMAGTLLGKKYGALSQAVYVLLGLVGVPIFALGGGFSYVFQPTFGFLLGLIPSAWVIGSLARRPLTFWRSVTAMLAGLAVLYAIGVPYMALIANAYLGKGLTFWQVLKNGMLIYLPGDMLKIAAGSALSCAVTRRIPNL